MMMSYPDRKWTLCLYIHWFKCFSSALTYNTVNINKYNHINKSFLGCSIKFKNFKGSWNQKVWELLNSDFNWIVAYTHTHTHKPLSITHSVACKANVTWYEGFNNFSMILLFPKNKQKLNLLTNLKKISEITSPSYTNTKLPTRFTLTEKSSRYHLYILWISNNY